jgi:peptidyl-prolyl cis-trans isomerase C
MTEVIFMRKKLCILMVCVFLFLNLGLPITVESAANDAVNAVVELNSIPVFLNGNSLDTQTFLYNNRVYVPLRDMCYFFKNNLDLNTDRKILNILPESGVVHKSESTDRTLKGTLSIDLYPNPYKIQMNGIDTYLDSFLYMDTTYVPLRYFAEMFSKKIEWNGEERAVYVNDISEIIGTVNGENITRAEVDFYYNDKVNNLMSEEQKNSIKEQAFNSAVKSKIHKQKAEENQIILDKVDLGNINYEIHKFIEMNGGVIDLLRDDLAKYNIYFSQVALNIKEVYTYNKLYKKLTASISATEEKIKHYYEENKARYLIPEKVRAKHILISSRSTDGGGNEQAKKEAAKKKAEEILAKINAGENFDALMHQNSEDPGLKSYPNGYTFGAGQMVKEFENAAFVLKVGEVSGLIETAYGYHIIKLEEKIPQKQLSLDEVRDGIKAQLSQAEKQTYINGLVEKWMTESKIENTHQ